MHYRFDAFDVDASRGQLRRQGHVVPLTGKAFEMLLALVEARGEIVEKEDLMRRLWPDTAVEEGNLTQQISTLRKALGESPGDHKYILTIARRGYRFVAPVSTSARPGAAPEARTVGRSRETAEIQRAFDQVRSGSGMLLCISGEAGIGKSTLVAQFLDRVDTPCLILRGRCSERLAPGEPHLPVLEALEVLLRTGAGAAIAQILLRRAPSWYAQVAPLAGRDRHAESDALKPSSQERQKREIAAFLEDLAATSPVVLWLDDIHWADPSTLDLIVYLTTRCDATQLLVIGTYRPAEMLLGQEAFVQSVRDLRARGRCREVTVDFLSRTDVDDYLALEFPEHAFPPELATLLHQRTEGNPLFLTDLVRDLKDRGDISTSPVGWTVTQPLPALARGFPDSIRNLIDRTIARLDDTDRQILATGSVQGVQLDSDVVASAMKMPAPDVEERLARLARIHSIVRHVEPRETAGPITSDRYAFVHVLYHEALYASLVPSRRVAMSGAVADALREDESEQPQRIAHQLALLYEAACRPAEAIEQFLAAAQHAVAVSAMREAASLARRGLALAAALPQDRDARSLELQLLITLGVPLAAISGYANPEVERTYTRALALSRQEELSSAAFPAMWGLWVLYHVSGHLTRALETAGDLLAVSERAGDRRMIAASNILFGYTRGHVGELRSALDHLERAEAIFDPADHAFYSAVTALDPRVAGLAQQGRLLCLLGFADEAVGKARQAVELARSLRSPNAIGFALVWQAYVHQLRGEPALVRDVTAEALALAAEHGLADVQGWAAVWHAWTLDDPSVALSMMQQSLEAQRRFGSEIARPHQLALGADVRSRLGDLEGALCTIDEALEHSARTQDRYYEPELHRMKGELLLRSVVHTPEERTARAAVCFNEAIAIARRHGSRLFEQRAAASLQSL